MSSTKFTIPRGVKKIDVFCVGGGGSVNSSNKDGGSSSIGSKCSANGGCGGSNTDCGYGGCNGGNGGSGGAGGFDLSFLGIDNTYEVGGFGGGSDGSNGGSPFVRDRGGSIRTKSFGGTGQHSTTRYFGESTGTLYSTGGGMNTFISYNSGNGCGGSRFGSENSFGYGGGGYTKTSLEQSVTPRSTIPIVVGAGGRGSRSEWDGSSGICIIRWDDQKS